MKNKNGTAAVEEEKVVRVSSASPNQKSDNKIRNTKYTAITFLPVVFLQQFKSLSSIYFFLIMMIQLDSRFAISPFASSFFPWLFVLLLSLFNEGLDDYKRHQRDKESNSGLYKIWKKDSFVDVESAKIKVGDVLLINKGERVPADCLLLKVNDATGEIFIRTDQLDGETDWKRRIAHSETQNCPISCLDSLEATVELPHKDIYSFVGSLRIKNWKEAAEENSRIFHKEPSDSNTVASPEEKKIVERKDMPVEDKEVGYDLENTIWANTVCATCSALGLVIYTGNDTRSMMNTYRPRSKIGRIESELDNFTFLLGISSAIFSMAFTLLRSKGFTFGIYIIFVRFLILFSYVIPISLKVTINLARIFYLKMAQDAKGIRGAIVRSSSLQEELGRISYFLTDKTGTLTKNEMIMKKLHLGTICYTTENNDEIIRAVSKGREKMIKHRKSGFRKSKSLDIKAYELLEAMSVCHNVTPVYNDDVISYQASSPDEVAIVMFAEEIGIKLVRRDRVTIAVQNFDDFVEVYKILQIFPFNSDTKRMGIILERNGEIVFFEKGADTVMKKILKENDWAEEETDNMARDGLRTLLFGKKVLTRQQYEDFVVAYNQAKLSLTDRNEKLLAEQIKLEKDMELVGLTGVEDKLQDRVKQTLENLRNAGIKIWMLTGDKIETAISIALSSRLLNKMDRYVVISNCTSQEEIRNNLSTLKNKGYNALVIDGVSLAIVIDNFLEEFIQVTKDLSCIVGCRYTPTQKAVMAASLRTIARETVLCIGDGGNDVSMITEADVGVGIEGKEGNQASLAADFSLKNFADVCDLLFWHGRKCYKNTSNLAYVIIHRGTMLSVVQGIFCALIYYIPISILQGRLPMLYISLTFLPLYALVKSEDVPRQIALKFPELYKEMRLTNPMSFSKFLRSNVNSLFQGTVIMLGLSSRLQEMFSLSVMVFSCLIINEQLMICLTVYHITLQVILMCAASLITFLITFLFISELNVIKTDAFTIFTIICVSALSMSFQFGIRIYNRYFQPESHSKLGIYQ